MIYFDHAATSYPKPPEVIAAVNETIRKKGGNPGRSGHSLSVAAAEELYDTREALADFFSAEKPQNFVFTLNATHALNLAIKSVVKFSDHVIISDLEHNAVFRPIYRLHRDGQIAFSIFKTQGNILKNIEKVRRHNTHVLICTHVSNVNGQILPIHEISMYCQKHGIYLIVDASQSAGHVPLSLKKANIDALCAPAHKGLLGIQGAGFVYLRSTDNLDEYMEGGSGSQSLSPEMPKELPERYEAGTMATPAISGLNAGIRTIKSMGGVESIATHEHMLCKRAQEMVASFRGSQMHIASNPSGLFSFNLPRITSDELTEKLGQKKFAVRGGFHCAPLAHRTLQTSDSGAVRISFGISNTAKELEIFYQTLKDICASNH